MSAKIIPLRQESTRVLDLSDEALVAGCAAQDAAALSALYRRHHEAVYRFLSRMVGAASPELDDLAQLVFLAAWNGAGRYRGQSAVRSWLFGIAANMARKHHRTEKRRQNAFTWLSFGLKKTPPPPDETVSHQQLVDRLAKALDDLPHDLRVAYVMCELEEIAGVDAARALGIRPGTMWRRLHDARKRLRAMIEGGAR